MPEVPPNTAIDPRLRRELHDVAVRVRSRSLHLRSALGWAGIALIGFVWVALCWRFEALRNASFPGLAFAVLIVGWFIGGWWRREPFDYAAAAALVERDHPELQQALRTALEQRPDAHGQFHFLQRRVIERALEHADTHVWRTSRRHVRPWSSLAHLAGLGLVIAALGFSIRPPETVLTALTPRSSEIGAITVTPGNTEVERGSTVIVAARFDGGLPANATLVWTPSGVAPQRATMSRSLSDPVFAFTLPRVEQDVDYHVEYEGASSEPFRLQVFERPDLLRADAALDYPDFTGLTDRRIEDTRRLSAVEGTKVDYEFMFNKPVSRAVLLSPDGDEVELTAANPERTRYALNFTITESVRYTLHLLDDAARANQAPPDIRIEALANRRPDLKVTFPRGDQRVSALEEIRLQGEARDDFGLLDYGIAIAIGANPPEYVSLRETDEKTATARFEHLLNLEPRGVYPGNLVTWFAWADDAGIDGSARRTEGEPYFGEVRPFDEIFREQREGGGGMQGGGPGQELLELQRQISIGVWRLRQEDARRDEFSDNLDILRDSQAQARTMLSAVVEMERDPILLSAANEAGQFMDEAHEHLGAAANNQSTAPLAEAWTAAQGAYQALLRMQPRETNIVQSRNGRSSSGRNQRQLSQLKFRDNDDNYEMQSEAEAMTSPEEREKLETLARLKDLARRQQDVNERMQQLQTALQEAASDAERERIRRELKRLEEEQRRMLSELDDVRQRIDQQPPSNSARDAREQLDETRESMRQAGESLQQGDVSQALAQGTRAQDNLQQVSDELRKESSSRFAEQLRQARQAARELAESQQATQRGLDEFDQNGPRALDSSAERAEQARQIDQQIDQHEQLLRQLRQITEDSEVSEPGLHRQLYDLLREHEQSGIEGQMENSAELLRRGFVDQARELQPGITERIEELRQGVERAAESVLGDETSTLRFAQRELEDLTRQLENERGGSDPTGASTGAEDAQAQAGEPPAANGQTGAGTETETAQGPGAPSPDGLPGVGASQPQPGTGSSPNEMPGESGVGEPGIAQSERSPNATGTSAPDAPPGTGGQARAPGEQPGAGEQPGSSPTNSGTGESTNQIAQGAGQSPTAGQDPSPSGRGRAPGEPAGTQPGGTSAGSANEPGQQNAMSPGTEGNGETDGAQLAQGENREPGGQTGTGSSSESRSSSSGQSGSGLAPGEDQDSRGGAAGSSEANEDRNLVAGGTRGGPTGPGGGGADNEEFREELTRALEAFAGMGENSRDADASAGPITGENFTDWEERLRTVEALLDSPEARARLAAARERARELRGEYRRHATPPQWGVIEEGIAAPLSEVRTWLRQELARRENPTALQPVDRDPVPERFQENVRKYYEALGE